MNSTSTKQTVLITGASSGIGLGLSEAYAQRGANLVLNARNETKLTEMAKKLGSPEKIVTVVGDIGDKAVGQRMVDVALERFGRVDVLVNNAGHFYPKPFLEFTEEDLDRFLSVHLKGTYFTTQAAAKEMSKTGGGAIVNITTVLAIRGVSAIPASAPVSAKGAMNALTRSLAIELAKDNIRVNTVAPGIIKTPIHGRTDSQFEELNGMQPLGRVGEVKDIVDAVVYLADANFVTGVVLPVDGGIVAGG